MIAEIYVGDLYNNKSALREFVLTSFELADKVQELEEQIQIKHDGFMAAIEESTIIAKKNKRYREEIKKALNTINNSKRHSLEALDAIDIMTNLLEGEE